MRSSITASGTTRYIMRDGKELRMIMIDIPMPSSCGLCFYQKHCNGKHLELVKDEDGSWMPEYVVDDCPLIEVTERSSE